MGKIKKTKRKLGLIARFLTSYMGQRFFNFAYSIGAAIVIWGALFKILHLPGGNTLLSIGMGTEVLMFLLTAFDRPPKEYKWEEVFPVLDSGDEEDRPDFSQGTGIVINGGAPVEGATVTDGQPAGGVVYAAPQVYGGSQPASAGTYNGGVRIDGPSVGVDSADDDDYRRDDYRSMPAQAQAQPVAPVTASPQQIADLSTVTQTYMERLAEIATEMERLRETTTKLNQVSDVLLQSYQAITQHSNEINESSTGYVDQMQNLNRNISGLNTIYEIQLKSVSSQLDAIDKVNRGIKDISQMYERSASQSNQYCEETEKMAMHMHQLNQVYEKMLTAMTVNMYRPMMGADAAAAPTPSNDSENQ